MANHFFRFSRSLFGKLWVARIFAFVLNVTLLMAVSSKLGSVLTQICSLLLVMVLLFSTAWEWGEKDKNRIATGKLRRDPLLGAKAGLLAAAPDMVAAACLLLTKAGVLGEAYAVFFGLYNANFSPLHQTLLTTTLTVAEHSWWQFIACAATVLVAPLCAAFGYALGLTGQSLADLLLYTTPAARDRHAKRVERRRVARKARLR